MTATPEQRAALAALVGITPETHPMVFPACCHICGSTNLEECEAGDVVSWHCQCGGWQLPSKAMRAFHGPDPFAPGRPTDDVWLSPLMWWMRTNGYLIEVSTSDGYVHMRTKQMRPYARWGKWCTSATETSAVLHAALSARVPEIVAIFGEGTQ